MLCRKVPTTVTQALAEQFATNGYVVVDNIFETTDLDRICGTLSSSKFPWFRTLRHANDHGDFRIDDPEIENHESIIEAQKGSATFLYRFDRSRPHAPGCQCELCEFQTELTSESQRELVYRISGKRIANFEAFYATRFRRGDFLTTHSDPLARIGFVLNLTKQWNPVFGGILHILDDRNAIRYSASPTFGSFILFDIETRNIPHFVSEVVCDCDFPRLGVAGRWGGRDGE